MTKLPDRWEIKRLDEIADVVMGQSPPGSSYNEHGEGQPFFQGKTEFGEVHPTVRKYTTAGTKFAKAGDILMSVRAPVGPTNIADIDCVIGRGLAAIRAKTVVSQGYLRWTLKHLEIDIQSKGTGTTFDAIRGETLRGTLIALPPIDEQHKIVELLEDHLSRLDAALADVKQAKIKAAQFRMTVLHSIFNSSTNAEDWKSTSLEKIGVWKTGSTPLSKNPEFQGSDVKFVTPGDIGYGGKLNSVARTISSKGADSVRRILPPSVHLVCIGTIGKVAWTKEIVTTNQQINSLEVDASANNPEFLMWLLASPGIQEKLWSSSSSTTVPILNKGNLEKIECSLPSLETQNEIMKFIDISFSKLEEVLETTNQLENQSSVLRRSLLQAAFTGQLTEEVISV